MHLRAVSTVFFAFAFASALASSACSSPSPASPADAGADVGPISAPPQDAGTATDTDGATAPANDADIVTCQNDSRVDAYAANLTKTSASGAVKVTLVSSDPAPPSIGTNIWMVRVTDASGAPMNGLKLGVTPFMPDHGHGPTVRPQVTAQDDGTYQITTLDLFMQGVWRVTLAVPMGDAGTESVQFFFCVTG